MTIGGSSPPGTTRSPGTPTGRAAWPRPRRLQVQPLSWARPGRQPEDHPGLEPPDAAGSNPAWATEQTIRPRGAVRSARLPVTQEIAGPNPVEGACEKSGAVRKPEKRPSSNLGELRVRLPPAPPEQHATIGYWQAQLAVTQPSLEDLQVQLLLVALTRWPVRLSAQDTSFSRWRGGFDSCTGC